VFYAPAIAPFQADNGKLKVAASGGGIVRAFARGWRWVALHNDDNQDATTDSDVIRCTQISSSKRVHK
jgi:hypothetical protein